MQALVAWRYYNLAGAGRSIDPPPHACAVAHEYARVVIVLLSRSLIRSARMRALMHPPLVALYMKRPIRLHAAYSLVVLHVCSVGAAHEVAAVHAPVPAPLHVLSYGRSANGFTASPRGWNSWGLIANHKFNQTQAAVLEQCMRLRRAGGQSRPVCSLDSGWSAGCNGDDHGRIIPDIEYFPNMALLGRQLRSSDSNAGLGVYVIPGTFSADRDKVILGTNVTLGSTWKEQDITKHSKFCRMEFDYSRPGVQEWHNSVVDLLCDKYSVAYIKLDYMCPTRSPDGCQGFTDSRPAAAMFHTAIARSKCNGSMRLGLSWMLDWDRPFWDAWNETADSMRTDEDINNSGELDLVRFSTVQRAIERYRVWVSSLAEGLLSDSPTAPIGIRPDMDNLFVSNPLKLSGLHPAQRQTAAMMWIGAGANLLEGGDLTQMDELGEKLLYDPRVHGAGGIVDRFGEHPMQPRNPKQPLNCPSHWPWRVGGANPQQLQAWIAGPNAAGDALVILSNFGPDEYPRTGPGASGTFMTRCAGNLRVQISYQELGLAVGNSSYATYDVSVVWDGRQTHRTSGVEAHGTEGLAEELGPWESIMYALTRL